MVNYNYSLSSDFGGTLNSLQLHEEIENNVVITTTLDGVTIVGDNVAISFVSSLSAPEQTELNTLVSNYTYSETTNTAISPVTLFVEENEETSTSSTNFQTKINLQATNLPPGAYKVTWTYNWRSSSSSPKSFMSTRVLLNDVTELGAHIESGKTNNNDDQLSISGFSQVNLTSGTHSFKLQFKRTGGNATFYIKNAKLELLKI